MVIIENKSFTTGDEHRYFALEPHRAISMDTTEVDYTVTHCRYLTLLKDQDGLSFDGPLKAIVKQCEFTNTSDPRLADELSSVVDGGTVVYDQCYFHGNGKGVLIGSGDTNISDRQRAQTVIFHECVFENNSRRNPFNQIGHCYVNKCLIRNWGIKATFHEKSYGIRSGSWGQTIVQDSLFEQESFTDCLSRGTLLKDMFHQYVYPLFFLPGFMRAAYADHHGDIRCYHCHKNRWWLYLQNHMTKAMSESEARQLAVYLIENVVDPWHAV